MKPHLALLFAIISVILVGSIGFAIATKLLWLVILTVVSTVSWLGFSFAFKARLGRSGA